MASRRVASGSWIRAGIVSLTLVTALIHLQLLFPDPVFMLNGLGFLALLSALYLPIPALAPYRRWVRWALIGLTSLTLVLWLAFGSRIPIAYIDKLVEVALLALLLVEDRRDRAAGVA